MKRDGGMGSDKSQPRPTRLPGLTPGVEARASGLAEQATGRGREKIIGAILSGL
jgi:hypothetical protein